MPVAISNKSVIPTIILNALENYGGYNNFHLYSSCGTTATKRGNTTNIHLHLKHYHPVQFSNVGNIQCFPYNDEIVAACLLGKYPL